MPKNQCSFCFLCFLYWKGFLLVKIFQQSVRRQSTSPKKTQCCISGFRSDHVKFRPWEDFIQELDEKGCLLFEVLWISIPLLALLCWLGLLLVCIRIYCMYVLHVYCITVYILLYFWQNVVSIELYSKYLKVIKLHSESKKMITFPQSGIHAKSEKELTTSLAAN